MKTLKPRYVRQKVNQGFLRTTFRLIAVERGMLEMNRKGECIWHHSSPSSFTKRGWGKHLRIENEQIKPSTRDRKEVKREIKEARSSVFLFHKLSKCFFCARYPTRQRKEINTDFEVWRSFGRYFALAQWEDEYLKDQRG